MWEKERGKGRKEGGRGKEGGKGKEGGRGREREVGKERGGGGRNKEKGDFPMAWNLSYMHTCCWLWG